MKAERLWPTLRKMFYRLIELGVMTKSNGNYDRLTRKTAEARRGVDSTFTKITNLPSLPLYCFRDEKRATIGDTDINKYPVEPTPADWPEDPEEYIDDAIQTLKDAPEDYDGKCYGESRGVNCGKWYLQPKYCEIWCESETIQPDLLKFQDDINVRVAASGGFISTPLNGRLL